MTKIFLEKCMEYVANGFNPTPAKGKRPVLSGWQNRRPPDEGAICEWAKCFSNIAILTGEASQCFAVDIDAKHGGLETLKELTEKYGAFPPTLTSQTGGGGLHLIYNYSNFHVENRTNIFQEIDIRGDGGCIIVPPSIHESGKAYAWLGGKPDRKLIADAPLWLLDLLKKEEISNDGVKKKKFKPSEPILEGCRNEVLTSVTGQLLSKRVDPEVVHTLVQALNKFSCKPEPLKEEEVSAIVESICRRENKKNDEIDAFIRGAEELIHGHS